MNQQTNENNSTSCSYQELNPEMDAFLQGKLVITCQNDGAKSNDIENILSSKGGMLFLTVLINGNGGNIQYLEKDGILTATAVLGRKNEDITI